MCLSSDENFTIDLEIKVVKIDVSSKMKPVSREEFNFDE